MWNWWWAWPLRLREKLSGRFLNEFSKNKTIDWLYIKYENTSGRKQLFDFSHGEKWWHSQVNWQTCSWLATREWLAQANTVSCTAAASHSKISSFESSNSRVRIYCHSRVQTPLFSLESSNSRVRIYRETTSRMLHPRLLIASDQVASASLERVRRCIWAVLYLANLTMNECTCYSYIAYVFIKMLMWVYCSGKKLLAPNLWCVLFRKRGFSFSLEQPQLSPHV